MAAHLAQAAKRRPKLLEEFEGPELPWVFLETWETFLALHRTRRRDMGELEAISYQEIDSWSRLTRNRLTPFQVDALAALDQECLEIHLKRSKRRTDPESKPNVRINRKPGVRHQHPRHRAGQD
jgi:hypothetical protein